MRPTTILAMLLLAASTMAHAGSPRQALQQQRAKINDAIDVRNRFLDRIGFVGNNNDSAELASINGSELTVVYALQSLDDLLTIVDNKSATVRGGLKQVGNSMLMICQAQVAQLVSDSAQLDDPRIRKEVGKQVDNVRTACGAIVAATN